MEGDRRTEPCSLRSASMAVREVLKVKLRVLGGEAHSESMRTEVNANRRVGSRLSFRASVAAAHKHACTRTAIANTFECLAP